MIATTTADDRTSYVEHVSAHGFARTTTLLEQAIANAGMILFAVIDHEAAARDVGLAMPPTRVLIYGNPRGGTPIMLAAPRAALDLPLRVLVRDDGAGWVLVGFHPINQMLQAAGVPEDLVDRLVSAQSHLIDGVRA